jgi:hypothetical protein
MQELYHYAINKLRRKRKHFSLFYYPLFLDSLCSTIQSLFRLSYPLLFSPSFGSSSRFSRLIDKYIVDCIDYMFDVRSYMSFSHADRGTDYRFPVPTQQKQQKDTSQLATHAALSALGNMHTPSIFSSDFFKPSSNTTVSSSSSVPSSSSLNSPTSSSSHPFPHPHSHSSPESSSSSSSLPSSSSTAAIKSTVAHYGSDGIPPPTSIAQTQLNRRRHLERLFHTTSSLVRAVFPPVRSSSSSVCHRLPLVRLSVCVSACLSLCLYVSALITRPFSFFRCQVAQGSRNILFSGLERRLHTDNAPLEYIPVSSEVTSNNNNTATDSSSSSLERKTSSSPLSPPSFNSIFLSTIPTVFEDSTSTSSPSRHISTSSSSSSSSSSLPVRQFHDSPTTYTWSVPLNETDYTSYGKDGEATMVINAPKLTLPTRNSLYRVALTSIDSRKTHVGFKSKREERPRSRFSSTTGK